MEVILSEMEVEYHHFGETVQSVLNFLYRSQFSFKFSNFVNLVINVYVKFQCIISNQFSSEIADVAMCIIKWRVMTGLLRQWLSAKIDRKNCIEILCKIYN